MSDNITFERLCNLKEEKNVRIEEISKATNIGKNTLTNYFTKAESVEKMTMTNLFSLARFFNVSGEYLCGGTDIKSWVFICPDGEKFTPADPVYDYACREFVEHLKGKGYVVEGIK